MISTEGAWRGHPARRLSSDGDPLRASQIESLAITGFDALHLAAAEFAGCDYLVTTDDRLLKKSQRHPSQLMVTLLNPIDIISLP